METQRDKAPESRKESEKRKETQQKNKRDAGFALPASIPGLRPGSTKVVREQ